MCLYSKHWRWNKYGFHDIHATFQQEQNNIQMQRMLDAYDMQKLI